MKVKQLTEINIVSAMAEEPAVNISGLMQKSTLSITTYPVCNDLLRDATKGQGVFKVTPFLNEYTPIASSRFLPFQLQHFFHQLLHLPHLILLKLLLNLTELCEDQAVLQEVCPPFSLERRGSGLS